MLVAADPLGAVAAAWQAMWEVTAIARGSDEFELRAAEALAAWRAKRFELPDYYLVLADEAAPGGAAAAPGAGSAGDGAPTSTWGRCAPSGRTACRSPPGPRPRRRRSALLGELGSLRHGRWWPPLEEVFAAARGFYPGTLAESPAAGQASLLS